MSFQLAFGDQQSKVMRAVDAMHVAGRRVIDLPVQRRGFNPARMVFQTIQGPSQAIDSGGFVFLSRMDCFRECRQAIGHATFTQRLA